MSTVTRRVWTDSKGRRREAWRISYIDASGERRHVQRRTKKDADAYALTVEIEKRQGVHVPDADSLTVKDAAHIWLGNAEADGCDRGTLKSYREIANKHIIPLLGAKKLTRLSGPEVVAFKDALLKTRSRAMTAKAVRHLSMILGEAVRRGLVGQNAARGIVVKRPRRDGKRQRLAKRAEIPPIAHLKLLLEAAERLGGEDPRLPIVLLVVMLAGIRASELRGFAWPGANLGVSASLTVSQRADRWNDLGPPKSDAGYRTIPIGPMLVHSLKAWRLRCPPSPLNLMFPATRRDRRWSTDRAELGFGPIKQGALSSLFLRVQVEAGLALDTGRRDAKGLTVWKARYGWHDLRHVAASNWLNDGIDLKRLQTWIGHENIQLTIDVYGHLMADAKKDAALAAGAETALLA
jgi:integrase